MVALPCCDSDEYVLVCPARGQGVIFRAPFWETELLL